MVLRFSRKSRAKNSRFTSKLKNWFQSHPFLVLLLIFGLAGIGLSYHSLNNYWYDDDLHLMRVFRPDELASTWVGSWDIDRIETPGFRPLATLMAHFRALVFGEAVALHRLFLVGMFALCLALFGKIFLKLNLPFWVVLIAGLLTFAAKNNAYQFASVTSGIHPIQGVTFGLAALSLFSSIQKHSRLFLEVSFLLALTCLLMREEGLELFVILVLLGAYYLYNRNEATTRSFKWLSWYTAGLFMVALVYWLWRALVVPEAAVRIGFLGALQGLIQQLKYTIWLADQRQWGLFFTLLAAGAILLSLCFPLCWQKWRPVDSAAVRDGWQKFAISLFRPTSPKSALAYWQTALGLLVLTVLASLHGLVTNRSNLALFSTYFYTLFLATLTTAYSNLLRPFRFRRIAISLVAGSLLFILTVSVQSSFLMQESMDFYSLQTLSLNLEWAYNPELAFSVPPERRKYLLTHLQALGLTGDEPAKVAISRLYCRAQALGLYHPTSSHAPFIPLIPVGDDDEYAQLLPEHC